MANNQEVVLGFGRLADEFLLNIILLKTKDQVNGSLPFIHAHVLELSAKAAYYAIEPSILGKKANHNIRAIYDSLCQSIDGFSELLPDASSYKRYRELWLNGDGPHVLSTIPPPAELFEWEVCYFIDNIVDLKYGYTKNLDVVSALRIGTPNLNPKFKELFKTCRLQYATAEMNSSTIEKGLSMFGNTTANLEALTDIFGGIKCS